jgi:hypothetical protein
MKREVIKCNIAMIWGRSGTGISFLVRINGFGSYLMIKGLLGPLEMELFL